MSDQIPDVAVCRQKPVVTKISDDYYVVVYHRDIPLSIAFAELIKNTNRLLSGGLKAAEEVPSGKDEADEPPNTEATEPQNKEAAKPQNAAATMSQNMAQNMAEAMVQNKAAKLSLPPRKRPTTKAPEWKIRDQESRIIEYYGTALRFSKTQFGVMEALILAEDHILSYADIALAGWGEPTDRDVVEATIYQLNKYLKREDIDRFVSCRMGRMILVNKEQ